MSAPRFLDPSTPVGRVLARLRNVRRAGSGWEASCPAHEDHTPSLTIDEGEQGRAVLHCHRGCATEAIVAAIGLTMRDLFPADAPRPGAPRILETYDYTDAPGHVVFQVVRYEPKNFKQRRPGAAPGEWLWDMKGVSRVPYRLPELRAAVAQGRTVFVVEGEKDVHALERHGFVATTNAGGAGKWKAEYSLHLRGARVVVLPDNDEAGRQHGLSVARSLHAIASEVRVIELPELPPKGDVSDWLAAGHSADELKALVRATPLWQPPVTLADSSSAPSTTEPAAADGSEEASGTPEEPPPPALRYFPWTDIGNAERLVARHGRDLHYVPAWGKWLHWDTRRWAIDDTHQVERLAKETIRHLRVEAKALKGAEREELLEFARKCESNAKVMALLARAKAEPGIALRHSELEVDPWRLTVANGTLDLRTGELSAHRREDRYTRYVPVAYDADAECPRWRAFLERVLGGNAALLTFLQRAVGYSLTGSSAEQCLFFLHGGGANGKSTFLELLRGLLGEYATQADFSTFIERRHEGASNDVARLFGARVVTSSEVGEGKRLNESLVKSLTGSDTIAARFLYAESFEFRPTFKLWLAANHKPVIRGSDAAIWRRIRLVPFTVQIPEAERDTTLPEQLRAELPGILRWAVEGCLAWLESGLSMPDEVRLATEDYRRESDIIGAFLEECCEVDPMFSEPAKALYDAYKRWAESGGEYVLSQTAFGSRLEERGHGTRKSGTKFRVGLRLKGDDRAEPTHDRGVAL